jgi:predicted RNA binding protein YcfA (HicA-like mRNA interferase family)
MNPDQIKPGLYFEPLGIVLRVERVTKGKVFYASPGRGSHRLFSLPKDEFATIVSGEAKEED